MHSDYSIFIGIAIGLFVRHIFIILYIVFNDKWPLRFYISYENKEKLDIIKKETYIEPEAYCRKIIEEHLRSK